MFDTLATSDPSTKRQRRSQTCHDVVPQLLVKGQLEAAKSVCRKALELESEAAKPSIADVWYSLGLVHDIAHEHEEVERCMRKALSYHERPEIWPYLAEPLLGTRSVYQSAYTIDVMNSSSADTNCTFGDNTVAVAEGKRKSQGPQHLSINDEVRESNEEYREEYLEFKEKYGLADLNNEMLAENIKVLQNEVSVRNQVIHDIETKFTEYLRGYYQSVNSEFQMLNDRLAGSTVEVREYQAELMVAAQDDEGSTMRIQDLEQKRNLAEDVAKRSQSLTL
eukprot:s4794_g4.t1